VIELQPMSPKQDQTYIELKSLAEKYPENKLLQTKLKYYSPYQETDKTDDEILYEALKEKYNLQKIRG
jgi:hypothetical protein